jgi:hypothetical protein
MKVTKKMVALLAGIFSLTLIIYFLTGANVSKGKATKTAAIINNIEPIQLPQPNSTPDVNVLQNIPPMPTTVQTDNSVISNLPDLDRMPLDDESISLLPANEMIEYNYKDWYAGAGAAGACSGTAAEGVDKELYAKVKPLFNQTGKTELVPLDINSEKRRINFY